MSVKKKGQDKPGPFSLINMINYFMSYMMIQPERQDHVCHV